MAAFLQVFIDPKASVTPAEVEKKLDLAIDWFRYHDKMYVLYTTSSVAEWQARLLGFVQPGGFLFICRLNIDGHNGFMAQTFWDWINKWRYKH